MVQPEPRKKALVIAVSEYAKLDKLDFCKTNGNEVYSVLVKLGFDVSEKQKIVGNVDYEKMRTSMISFFRDKNITSDDTVLFYFSGHGNIPRNGGRFFCTSNYDEGMPEQDGIPFDFLTRMMNVCSALKKVAIIDCCFSGDLVLGAAGMGGTKNADKQAANVGRDELSKEFENSAGQVVLASSLGTNESFAHPTEPYSAFSYYVIKGLNGEAVDEQGIITTKTLYEYVHKEFSNSESLNGQQPVDNGHVAGKILLGKYPHLAQKPELPIEEQLISLLREGKIEEYQTLKRQNPERILDLDGFVFPENADLRGIDLRWASLVGVDFSKRDLSGAILTHADLTNAVLIESNLKGAFFDHCQLISANLNDANLERAILRSCDLTNADCTATDFTNTLSFETAILNQAVLHGAVFNQTTLTHVTFNGTMIGAKFIKSKLRDVTFSDADLTGADFSGADTEGLKFVDCKLSGTTFKGSRLAWSTFVGGTEHSKMDLSDSILDGATFNDLRLSDANFSHAQLYKARFTYSRLSRPNFTDAKFGGTDFKITQIIEPIPQNFNPHGEGSVGMREHGVRS